MHLCGLSISLRCIPEPAHARRGTSVLQLRDVTSGSTGEEQFRESLQEKLPIDLRANGIIPICRGQAVSIITGCSIAMGKSGVERSPGSFGEGNNGSCKVMPALQVSTRLCFCSG